jgi:tetratricopeptide (TPR) repeat protein
MKRKDYILSSLFLLTVFILAIIKIEDTDTWTHLSFGRWIWENRSIPLKEPFITTSAPFPYNNWLFGFVYYMVYHFFSIYGVILLKAITVTTAFFILLKDSLRPHRNIFVSIVILALVVIISRSRFVERPDTFLMIFLPFSIFSLNAYVYERKKYIYALPLIHMLWANSHTSITLMFIPFISFIAGGILQQYLNKRFSSESNGEIFSCTPSRDQMKTIIYIFILSFFASLISPYFISQYTVSFGALNSDWWKQEILELQKPAWKTMKYPFIIAPSVILLFLLNLLSSKKRGLQLPSLIHLIIILPFLYLSFTAMRFIFLAAIVSGPVVARSLSSLFNATKFKDLTSGPFGTIIAILVLLIYPLLILFLGIGPFSMERKITGFGINYDTIPEKALQYMDKRGIYGNVFNLFQWGGYIIWRDFPMRRPFIDGRGFLSSSLLEQTGEARKKPEIMRELEERYKFDVVLLGYPILLTDVPEAFSDVDIAFSNRDWALVYWDDDSLVYLRRYKGYDEIIKIDEYKYIKPANGIKGMKSRLFDSQYRGYMMKELQRNVEETGSTKAYTYLGFLYNEEGKYDEAIKAYSSAMKESRTALPEIYDGLAYAYLQKGMTNEAIQYYERSASLFGSPSSFYKLGVIYLGMKEYRKAMKYLEKAIKGHPYLVSVYPMLMDIYNKLDMKEEFDLISKRYKLAISESEGESHFKEGLKAYMSGQFEKALGEFRKSIEVNPSNPVPYSNIGYIYYDIGDLTKAFDYHRRALEIDPDYGNSHYGLALIYKRWGDYKKARYHWEEYLRIEPSGYYSRRAKEELMSLDKLLK